MSVSITVYRGDYAQHLQTFVDTAGNLPHNGWLNWFWSNPGRVGSDFASTQTGLLDGDQTVPGIVARADTGKPFHYGGSARGMAGSLDRIEFGTGIDTRYLVTRKKILFDFNGVVSSTADGDVRRIVCSFIDPKGIENNRPAFQDLHAYLDTQNIVWRGTSEAETFVSYAKSDTYRLSDGGKDTILYRAHASGHDTVHGFDADNVSPGHDMIRFSTCIFANADAVLSASQQAGSDTIIGLTPCSSITLKNVARESLDVGDFAFV